ncbi:MAG: pyridoxal-phosphate dependent enzyme [Anaerolineae bacterium]|nr:pyridoxal-phosphate dependent enzyme [Anaerolineae bacterium]
MGSPALNTTLARRFPQVAGLRCVLCSALYSLDEVRYTCPACGPVGTLDVVYHAPEDRRPPAPGTSPYTDPRFVPIAADTPLPTQTIPLSIGGTPHYPRSATLPFAIKDDGRNPTASFKDRASAMVVHHGLTMGVPVIATASTGNAAAALAGICAAVQGPRAVIFVPASAPQAKIAQLLIYGARVILVDGTYDQAFDLCWEACETFGWYNRSTGINPFTSEGKKTVSWEIAFSPVGLPDVIMTSVGDGSIIASVYKGFSDLKQLGWIDRIPRLIGVQSSGSDALTHAWQNGLDAREMIPRPAETVADSISAALPRDRAKALRAVRETEGAFMCVSDAEILAAIPSLARSSGIFAEPAAAASYAGWQAARRAGWLDSSEHILLLLTGSGLKDVARAMQAVQQADKLQPIAPTLAAVREVMDDAR